MTTQSSCFAYGIGIRRKRNEKTLDVTFTKVGLQPKLSTWPFIANKLPKENGWASLSLEEAIQLDPQLKEVKHASNTYSKSDYILYLLFTEHQAVTSAEEAYLKLHLISFREVKPHTVSLEGAFAKLQNVAWTNYGPMLPEDVAQERIKWLQGNQPLVVSHVDKFPYLVNYHVPSGVRIAAGSQARLGAYLGTGTTIMPAGYVNFNAGTEGHAMVEGRVSAGVVVGDQSDIGGGASIMGTLSGGNKTVISVGKQCLLGANAGAGISLGDGCTIAAGLYLTAGTKVSLYNEKNEPIDLAGNLTSENKNVVKAASLSGRSNLLFLHDSLTGKVIARPNGKVIELNQSLHTHN